MPVYEYLCPQCYGELEVLRPLRGSGEYSDCPNCGGKAWRLVSGFGSKTGSYLQPSATPFRDEFGLQPSRSETVATAMMDDVHVDLLAEGQQESLALEMSWLLESQPNGSNIWFIHNWGIASILRYLREDLEAEPAERMRYLEDVMSTRPAEGSLEYSPGPDQRIEYPSVRPWPEERVTEPVEATDSDVRLADDPMAVSAKPSSPASHVRAWANDQPAEPARVTEPAKAAECYVPLADEPMAIPAKPWSSASRVRPWPEDRPAEPARVTELETPTSGQERVLSHRHWLPTSYFGWFLLLAAGTAVIVVPLVWILAMSV